MNQQNQQPPFQSFIIPLQGPQQPAYRPQPHEETPARVQIAMELLQQLIIKQMPRAAVSDNSIEWAGDQGFAKDLQISLAEIQTRDAACDLLTGYFKGNLKPTAMEKVIQQQIKGPEMPEVPGQYLHCPDCRGVGYIDGGRCRMCQGFKSVYIYPAATKE